MAKLTFTPIIFVVFFFFFSLSHARTSPETDVINNESSNALPPSHTTTTILLPSNNPELNQADTKPMDINIPGKIPRGSDAIDDAINVGLRPINNLHLGKNEFALGVPLRRCQHGHIISTNPGTGGGMIISGDGSVVYPTMVPVMRLRHHQYDGGIEGFRSFKHQIFGKDKHERIFRSEPEIESKKESAERSRGSFVNSIRKFLIPK